MIMHILYNVCVLCAFAQSVSSACDAYEKTIFEMLSGDAVRANRDDNDDNNTKRPLRQNSVSLRAKTKRWVGSRSRIQLNTK